MAAGSPGGRGLALPYGVCMDIIIDSTDCYLAQAGAVRGEIHPLVSMLACGRTPPPGKVHEGELWPQLVHKRQVRVRCLPRQEVRQPGLPRGAHQQVDGGRVL